MFGDCSQHGSPFRPVPEERSAELGRLLSLVMLGDLTSIYIAVLDGIDPTPVELIDRLTAELASA